MPFFFWLLIYLFFASPLIARKTITVSLKAYAETERGPGCVSWNASSPPVCWVQSGCAPGYNSSFISDQVVAYSGEKAGQVFIYWYTCEGGAQIRHDKMLADYSSLLPIFSYTVERQGRTWYERGDIPMSHDSRTGQVTSYSRKEFTELTLTYDFVVNDSVSVPLPACSAPRVINESRCIDGVGISVKGSHPEIQSLLKGKYGDIPDIKEEGGDNFTFDNGNQGVFGRGTDYSDCNSFNSGESGVPFELVYCPHGLTDLPPEPEEPEEPPPPLECVDVDGGDGTTVLECSPASPSSDSNGSSASNSAVSSNSVSGSSSASGSGASADSDSGSGSSTDSGPGTSADSGSGTSTDSVSGTSADSGSGDGSSGSSGGGGTPVVPGSSAGSNSGSGGDGNGDSPNGVSCKELGNCDWAKESTQRTMSGTLDGILDAITSGLSGVVSSLLGLPSSIASALGNFVGNGGGDGTGPDGGVGSGDGNGGSGTSAGSVSGSSSYPPYCYDSNHNWKLECGGNGSGPVFGGGSASSGGWCDDYPDALLCQDDYPGVSSSDFDCSGVLGFFRKVFTSSCGNEFADVRPPCDPSVDGSCGTESAFDSDTVFGITREYLETRLDDYGVSKKAYVHSIDSLVRDSSFVFRSIRSGIQPFTSCFNSAGASSSVLDFSFHHKYFSCDAACKIDLKNFYGINTADVFNTLITFALVIASCVRLIRVAKTFGTAA